MKLVKGDKVIVISGKDKGKIGNIQKALPKEPNPEGSIQEVFAPIDVSNVMYYDEKSKKASRIGYKFDKDGKKIRVIKASGKEIK